MAAEAEEAERSLFVTNLDSRVTDELLYELCLQAGPVDQCSVADKHVSATRRQRIGVVIYKHRCSVSYAKDLFSGTKLYDRELTMSRENFVNLFDPENYGQASLRGLNVNRHMDRHINHDYNDRRNYRPERNHHDHRRDRPEPYNVADHRRHQDNRHFRNHGRSHNRERWN